MNKEIRSFSFEYGKEKEEHQLVGHAAVFDQVTTIGDWFNEQIEPGAFRSAIKKDDIRALFNHDPNIILGRNISGTLILSEDETGLKVSINPPDTQYIRDLVLKPIERGDLNQMSFAFQVLEEEWVRGKKPKDMDLRKIKKVRLYDVSPVTFPAYEGTDIAVRSHDEWIKTQPKEEEPQKDEALAIEDHNGMPYLRQQHSRRY